jgi:DNA-binding response OmpR family regulator
MGEARLEPPGVLLVEDDALVRHTLQRTLEAAGFRVWTAGDGPTGVELFRGHHRSIHAVLLDCHLPGFSGIEALAALRCIDARVPCCLMTGNFERCLPEKLGAVEPADVFYKPFKVDQLTARLRELVRARAHPSPLRSGSRGRSAQSTTQAAVG